MMIKSLMQSKLLPISATDILTLHRLTEMSVVSAKESVHVVFREKNLFVVSKVAAEHKTYEDAKASIEEFCNVFH
jgi:diketogulonate reductase-like aldo/keto reductase